MEELVKMLQERVGLSEDKARLAVSLVLEQVKKAVPAQFASQFDALLGQGCSCSTEGAEHHEAAGIAAGISKLF